MTLDEYRAANQANWSDRVAGHWEPDGYDAPGFIAEPEPAIINLSFNVPVKIIVNPFSDL